jgi:putative acetyltransferase
LHGQESLVGVVVISPDHQGVAELLMASDAYMASLYPSESNHMTGVTSLKSPEATLVARVEDGIAITCGAIVREPHGYAELKRMFVPARLRGMGLGKEILRKLISIAEFEGLTLRLETGVMQPEAVGLYQAHGFRKIGPFGHYSADPLSVFMERRIDRDG